MSIARKDASQSERRGWQPEGSAAGQPGTRPRAPEGYSCQRPDSTGPVCVRPERHTGASEGKKQRGCFCCLFFLSKYPRLSFHLALRLHRWQGGASSPATNDLLAPWARLERHTETHAYGNMQKVQVKKTFWAELFFLFLLKLEKTNVHQTHLFQMLTADNMPVRKSLQAEINIEYKNRKLKLFKTLINLWNKESRN